MTDPLADYAEACHRADLTRRPMCWAAHYGDYPLGDLGTPHVTAQTLQKAVMGVLAPFAHVPEVAETHLIIDAQAAIADTPSVFWTRLRLVTDGVNMTHWRVPYRITDSGRIDFAEPERAMALPTTALAVVSAIASQRLSTEPVLRFEDSMRASIAYLSNG